MPKVPILEPTIATKGTAIPEPQVLRPTSDAFGGDIANAKAGMGEQIQKTAQVATTRLIEMQQRDDEQAALDTVTKFQTDLQQKLNDPEVDENGRPKGFLVRQLGHAKGSVPEFDSQADSLKAQYMEAVQAPELKLQVAKVIDSHLNSAREQVIHNEASQREADFKNSLDANIKTSIASAAGITEPREMLIAVRTAQAQATGGYAHLGMDEDSVLFNIKTIASEMVKTGVLSQMETDPKGAQSVLTALKPIMNGDAVASIQKTLDGKIIHEKQLDAWNTVRGFRNADGTVDLGRVEKFAYGLKDTAEDKAQIFSFLHSMAAVENANVSQQHTANDRAFTNNLVKSWKDGEPVQKALQDAAAAGRDATDVLAKQKDVVDLYTGATNPFDKWLEKQDAGTKLAWDQVESMAKAKFTTKDKIKVDGVDMLARDAFLVEMKRSALGKGPDEVIDIAKKKLDKVDQGWFHFDKPRWELDAAERVKNSDAMLHVTQTYGDNLVNQAKQFLQAHNAIISPANLEYVIKAAKQAKQTNK